MHSIRPATVSMTFVCVLTCTGWFLGKGEAPGRVEEVAVLDGCCIVAIGEYKARR